MRRLGLVLLAAMALPLSLAAGSFAADAQKWCPDDRPKDWPSNWGKWGPDDGAGTTNYITPDVMKQAAGLIKQGKVIPLAMEANPGVSPKWPGRNGLIRFMAMDGADFTVARPYGTLAATESVVMLEDHGSTHIDPLVHVWWGNCTYNGYSAPEIIRQDKGLLKGSTNEYLPKSFTKGVLIDVAKYLNKDYVDKIDGTAVLTPELIDKIAAAEKVTITPGTAVLIRTGWMKQWTGKKPEWQVSDGHVGVSCGIEKWLQEKQVSLLGADNVALEAIPAKKECDDFYKVGFLPMHIGVLSMLGTPMIELMDLDALAADAAKDGVYEFAFAFPPFRYVNASGGLVNPTAIK